MANIIVGNWKMYLDCKKSLELLHNLELENKNLDNVDLVICPTFIALPKSINEHKNNKIHFGAQDCFWEKTGTYTGEVSPIDLKELGCEYVIIGHSERRKYQQETDEMINKKVIAALQAGLTPILCVGESKEEREENKIDEVIANQLVIGLSNIHEAEKIIIAYEPIWAIHGTGEACSVVDAVQVHRYIRTVLDELLPKVATPILYGGSVDDQNVVDYVKEPEIAGVLVGNASTKLESFSNIINKINELS